MSTILITGVTGNIGRAVVAHLCPMDRQLQVIAATRSPEKAKKHLPSFPNLHYRYFDFTEPDSFTGALAGIETLFLLRPPNLSEVDRYFTPLLKAAKAHGVEQVVFLSVQGAEKYKVIPHNKIERIVLDLGFRHIFVRPSYFMQNLTTALLEEVRLQKITLPAGSAKFNWVDADNVGEAVAVLLRDFKVHQGCAYEITGMENKSFAEVADQMSKVLNRKIEFVSVNPIYYFFKKIAAGTSSGLALVMTMLHFLPRLQKPPEISENFKMLTGKTPTSLKDFFEREKSGFF